MSLQKIRSRLFRSTVGIALLGSLWTLPADASSVLLAGAGTEKVHSTSVTWMQKDGTSVFTVHPDYEGPLRPFAVIIPVPKDVTLERVSTLKREYGDRVALVSAPKYAEFWEMDPCSSEKHEQEWEQDLTVDSDTAFLGSVKTDATKKVAKEMLLDVEAKKKSGEYKEQLIGTASEIKAWLSSKSYALPSGADESFSAYENAGYRFLLLDVDTNRVELVGSDRAILSPVRFWTEEPVKSLPSRFGLPSAAKMQEYLLFTMVPGKRMQVTNYNTKAAPTNLSVMTDHVEPGGRIIPLKERTGELFAALHDRFLEKNPDTFLLEYAFPTNECGKPCTTSPLLPHELLSLGGDVFESKLADELRHPVPPDATAEETAKLEALLAEKKTPKEKKEATEIWESDRKELAARKAMIARNEYVLSRLHYRYSATGMPRDIELGEGAPIQGGMVLPTGEGGIADTTVGAGKKNQYQTRLNGLYPNIVEVTCDDPKPHRWGKPPRSYRGLRKTWVAEDLARRDRKRIDPNKAVLTAVPELALPGVLAKQATPAAAPLVPAAADAEKEGDCGCRAAGSNQGKPWGWLAALVLLVPLLRRRASRRA